MNKATVIKSLIYKFTERFAVKGLGLVISIILARLLAPDLFGQLAILTVFTELSLTLVDGGLSTALVQSRTADDNDYSTVFYITLSLSAVMVTVLYFLAPVIAAYYNSPLLVMPLRFYSLSLFFSAFNSMQVARMQREMRFREMMFCNLAATVIAGTLGISLAFAGFGLWALVGYFFAQIAVSCAAMALTLRWFPHSRFSVDSAKRLYGFGIKMLAASIITTLYNNIRPLIIGKRFSTTSLGYYERGQRFSSTVSMNLDSAVQSVMFPVLARAQDDTEQLRLMLRRTQTMGAFIIFPVMVGMAAVAEPMVRVLLTDKWLPCVVFIQILCLAEAQVPLTSANLVIMKAMGRSDILMRLEVLRRSLMLIVLFISVFAFDSVVAIAIGFLISAWIDAYITSGPVKKLVGYGFSDQMRDLWPCMLSCFVMGTLVYIINLASMPDIAKLLLQAVCGVTVYVVMCRVLCVESFMYILNMLGQKRGKNNVK